MAPESASAVSAEHHRTHRVGWLRAAVLGANDGIVSVASLVIGVAAANASSAATTTAGIAGIVAGAMSMATGEFVSVSSQRDIEHADVQLEIEALERNHSAETRELAKIYEGRGVEPAVAKVVAEQLMAHDAIGAHMRDELGITEITTAKPLQAAWVSALAFSCGAILPLLTVMVAPRGIRIGAVAVVALVALLALGALSAQAGGAPLARGAARVLVWSSLAMVFTFAVGQIVGANV